MADPAAGPVDSSAVAADLVGTGLIALNASSINASTVATKKHAYNAVARLAAGSLAAAETPAAEAAAADNPAAVAAVAASLQERRSCTIGCWAGWGQMWIGQTDSQRPDTCIRARKAIAWHFLLSPESQVIMPVFVEALLLKRRRLVTSQESGACPII